MANKTTRTPARDAKFLDAIRKGATVSDACAAACYTRSIAYTYRTQDPKFAEAWDEANEDAIERMEREADRRAVEGYDRPVFHNGVEVGSERRFSDVLLIFRLKAKRPDVYRERTELSGDLTVTNQLANRLDNAVKREKSGK